MPNSSRAPHLRKNLEMWERTSREYDARHAQALGRHGAMVWGLWGVPESELHILGDVRNLDVLEFGCGAARWSMALHDQGARVVGLDFSPEQLTHARRIQRERGVTFPLVRANAEAVPFRDRSFDVVFCDWGAMTFADPRRTVPEAARILRPGGLLAFTTTSPIYSISFDQGTDHPGDRLLRPYFGLERLEWPDEVNFQLPYGGWVRLFRNSGFEILDLVETLPGEQATSTYRDVADHAWARQWPMEILWRLRRAG